MKTQRSVPTNCFQFVGMALPIVTFFQRVRPTDSFNFVTTRPERTTTTTTTTTSIAIFSHSRFGQNTTTSMESQSVFFFFFLFLFLSLPSYLSSPRLPTVGVETQLILTVMLWNPIFYVPRKKNGRVTMISPCAIAVVIDLIEPNGPGLILHVI
jgi:hypothetical protein